MRWRLIVLVLVLGVSDTITAQVVNLNRCYRFSKHQKSMKEGERLVVKYKGMNTSNGAWVRDVTNDTTLAAGVCAARQRMTLVVDSIPAGTYELGFSGCWSGYSMLLEVRRRKRE